MHACTHASRLPLALQDQAVTTFVLRHVVAPTPFLRRDTKHTTVPEPRSDLGPFTRPLRLALEDQVAIHFVFVS